MPMGAAAGGGGAAGSFAVASSTPTGAAFGNGGISVGCAGGAAGVPSMDPIAGRAEGAPGSVVGN
eukprot:11163221-Alexandrium_andersonii.AAC.1